MLSNAKTHAKVLKISAGKYLLSEKLQTQQQKLFALQRNVALIRAEVAAEKIFMQQQKRVKSQRSAVAGDNQRNFFKVKLPALLQENERIAH